MNPIVFQFANGNAFFIGMVFVIFGFWLDLWRKGFLIRILSAITLLFGILLVVLSATPMPQGLFVIWLALTIVVFIFIKLKALFHSPPAYGLVILSTFSCLILIFTEIPYHLKPSVTIQAKQPVFVIGDSISAGLGSKERPWPEVLAERAHLQVKNLARAGATTTTALAQANGITEHNAIVIVEIGGNDLLGGTDAREFHNELEKLLQKISLAGGKIVMFEIPLIPFRSSFGAVQRALAKKYHAILLPKSLLTHVFAKEGGTLDGLHLSQVGHDALAEEVQDVMRSK